MAMVAAILSMFFQIGHISWKETMRAMLAISTHVGVIVQELHTLLHTLTEA